jgi:2-dehydropantoate 2-reductase
MVSMETIYILGSGAIGFPLAAYLANTGRTVVAVRTSGKQVSRGTITVTVHNGVSRISTPVRTIPLSELTSLYGTMVVTAKSYANKAIALELKNKAATGPVVIMQNGIGVEKPFLDAHFSPIYRCILYITRLQLNSTLRCARSPLPR